MKIMLLKEYMKQVFRLERLIAAEREQLSKLEEDIDSIGSLEMKIKVQTSKIGDPTAEAAALTSDLFILYSDDVARLLKLKQEITALINKLTDPRYKLILTERYINLKNWFDIAADNSYSWRNVHYLHSNALRALEKLGASP
jgi:hypothetical protein